MNELVNYFPLAKELKIKTIEKMNSEIEVEVFKNTNKIWFYIIGVFGIYLATGLLLGLLTMYNSLGITEYITILRATGLSLITVLCIKESAINITFKRYGRIHFTPYCVTVIIGSTIKPFIKTLKYYIRLSR